MSKEQWKPIKGYEGFYEISSFGRVRSVQRIVTKTNNKQMTVHERILKTYINKGYEYVSLCKDSIYERKKVHRLVAEAFIPNPHNYPCVNHKDEIKNNNLVTNLEWCTYEYNSNYGTHNSKLRAQSIKQKGRSVQQYDLRGVLVNKYECTKDLERAGFDRRQVYNCCIGKRAHFKGFVWRLDNKPFSLDSIKLVPVYKYDLEGNLIHVYKSINEAERDNNMSHHYLKNLHLGDRKNNEIGGFRYYFNEQKN